MMIAWAPCPTPDHRAIFLPIIMKRSTQAFHGTGDIFTATVLGAMMQGRTLEQAVTLAVDFTLECIRCTCADPAASWYGVEFEKALPWLARQK